LKHSFYNIKIVKVVGDVGDSVILKKIVDEGIKKFNKINILVRKGYKLTKFIILLYSL
jgi:NAD(P)-dependent dehydrogenase (short-subunit alcohol dehydrogenase family)